VTTSKVSDLKVLVVGVVRNVESTLLKDVKKFKEVLAGFNRIQIFVVESDSTDNSIGVLKSLKSQDESFDFETLGKLEQMIPDRTTRLAFARNRYLEEFETRDDYLDVDLLIVADFNNLNKKLNRASVESAFSESHWSVRTANQSGPYYDIWALRHPIWSPNDCWEVHEFLRRYNTFPELALYAAVNSRMIRIPKNAKPLAVQSAFGGFGIYKRSAVIGKRYSGSDYSSGRPVCEHVPFHKSIWDEGHVIEIYPKMINMHKTDHTYRFGLIRSMLRIASYLPKYLFKVSKP
jgi:hypothetical protein